MEFHFITETISVSLGSVKAHAFVVGQVRVDPHSNRAGFGGYHGIGKLYESFVVAKELESQIALGRLGWPEDCAKVVEFFCTDLSDYVTGQCLPVCGGYVLF